MAAASLCEGRGGGRAVGDDRARCGEGAKTKLQSHAACRGQGSDHWLERGKDEMSDEESKADEREKCW